MSLVALVATLDLRPFLITPLTVYTVLRADQSSNQRALYDVNQFTDTLTSLLHLPKVIAYEQEGTMPTNRFAKKHWKMVVILLVICAAILILRLAAMIWG